MESGREDTLKVFLELKIKQVTALALATDPEEIELLKKSIDEIDSAISYMQSDIGES